MSCIQSRSLHTRLKAGALKGDGKLRKNICSGNGNPDRLLGYHILCGTVGDPCHTMG